MDGSLWRTCRAAAHANAPLYPDVVPTLADLARTGLALAVVTDADTEWLAASVERNQLSIDVILSSEDAGCYKPHQALFRSGCERLGVSPVAAAYVSAQREWPAMREKSS